MNASAGEEAGGHQAERGRQAAFALSQLHPQPPPSKERPPEAPSLEK
jgi:hypothetical protein